MPNQTPVRLKMHKSNRLTRRQAETLIKALLTVDEHKLFQEQELKSFRAGFDKLTRAWREALERENEQCQNKSKSSTSAEKLTGSTLYPPSASKAKRAAPKIIYLRRTGTEQKSTGAAPSSSAGGKQSRS
jgi:soluble cytochrome b562